MRLRVSVCLAIATAMACLLGCGRGESPTRRPKQYTIEQFMNTKEIGGSSFSHDEQRILYSSDESGVMNAYAVPVEGGQPVQLTTSSKDSVFAVSYFPADDRILYLSDRGGNEIYHLYLREPDGTVTDLTPWEKARAVFHEWSHDLKSFYFCSNRRDPKFMDVYQVDAATLKPQLVYRNDRGLDLAAVSPDGRHFALIKQNTTHDSDMYLYDRKTKGFKHLTPHTGEISHFPQMFSVDSKSLYFLTDEDSEFAYLKRYELATGQTEKVEEAEWDIMYATLSRSGKYRVTGTNKDGRTAIRVTDTATGQPLALPEMPDAEISSVNISDSERWMTFYVDGSRAPNNLYSYNFATQKVTRLTDSMSAEIDPEDLVEAEVVRYQSFDGREIPAILYKPHLQPGSKVPALVWVHGGPGGQSRVGYSALIQYLANHGYVVLAVNNRGSSGYGKTFYRLDDRNHGQGDLDDCVESKKFLSATGYVDPQKIGIIGGSYGGYMVLAALAFRPDAFTVGVDIFGVANLVRTLKSIPPWWTAFRDALYKEIGNPETDEKYLRRISPLFHASRIRKPLIVLQGANDPRVLKVESDEIVEALKKNGVPVEYIVFGDEGHGFMKKANQIRAYQAILDFLDKYLKGAPA